MLRVWKKNCEVYDIHLYYLRHSMADFFYIKYNLIHKVCQKKYVQKI